jgi:hypothetical protein
MTVLEPALVARLEELNKECGMPTDPEDWIPYGITTLEEFNRHLDEEYERNLRKY